MDLISDARSPNYSLLACANLTYVIIILEYIMELTLVT